VGVVTVSGETQQVLAKRLNSMNEMENTEDRVRAMYLLVAFYIDEGYNERSRLL
jgi:hypothetical protein